MLNLIRLNNFKAFRELTLELAPLTLLSGLNGVGKSTTLQALSLLRQSADAGTLSTEGLLLNGDLVNLGTGQDVLHEDYATIEGRAAEISITLENQAGESREWTTAYAKDNDLLAYSTSDRSKGETQTPDWNIFRQGFQYLRADRIVPAVSYPKSFDAAIRRRFLGARGEHTVNYLRHHSDDHITNVACRHPSSASDKLPDQVAAWMSEFCPGVNLSAHDLEGTETVRLSFGFFGTAGASASNRYRPTNVGFGLTYVLPVIVAALSSAPDDLLLIENPEAHLHPRGQTRMGQLLADAAAGGAQLIIESHSDHLLNGLRLAVKGGDLTPDDTAIHYFDRADRGEISVVHPRISSEGMLSHWPPGFFDEWDRALDALLD